VIEFTEVLIKANGNFIDIVQLLATKYGGSHQIRWHDLWDPLINSRWREIVTPTLLLGPTSISEIKALFPESHDHWRIVYNALRPGRHENLPDGAAVA
jgi:hypothetical protein